MKNWEELTFIQKAFVGVGILCVAIFAPEIALLLQFGGIEVAFAFIALYLTPAIRQIKYAFGKVKRAVSFACFSYQSSASAKPNVFFMQASFCCIAFALSGSMAFSAFFFMPGLVLNAALI